MFSAAPFGPYPICRTEFPCATARVPSGRWRASPTVSPSRCLRTPDISAGRRRRRRCSTRRGRPYMQASAGLPTPSAPLRVRHGGGAAAGVWTLPTSKPCAPRNRRRERVGTSRAGPTVCHASGISRWFDGADLAIVQSASAATTTAPSRRRSGRGPSRLGTGMQRATHMPPEPLGRHAGQARQSPKRARYAVWKHTSIWMAGPSHSA